MTASAQQLFNDAIASLNAGRPSDAERHFKMLLRQQPNNVAALNILGALLAGQNKYAEAETHLRAALRLNANSDSTFYNYGVVLKGLGRLAEAIQQFDRALAINANVADTWNYRGALQNDLGQYQKALADFDRAIELRAGDPGPYCNRARSLEALGRHEDALASFDKALALAPNLPEAWLGRSNVLSGMARDQEAMDALDRALKLKPQLVEGWLAQGHLLTKHGRHEEAAASFQRALALRPEQAEAWLGRANALTSLGSYDEALAAYDKVLVLDPALPEAWVGRGTVFNETKRDVEAVAAFDRAIAIQPDLAEAWVGRGNALSLDRNAEAALASFAKAIEIKPTLAAAWNGRGMALCQLGRYENALQAIDQAISLDDRLAGCWISRGDVLVLLGRFDDGLVAYQNASNLNPKLDQPLVGIAQIIQMLGDSKKAIDLYDRALSIRISEPAIASKIFAMDFLEDAGFVEHQKARQFWWNEIGSKIARLPAPKTINRDPNRRIVLGYVSGDFRRHSAAYSFRPVLQHHDRLSFEIVGYDNSAVGDDWTAQFQAMADRWRHVPQMSDEAMANQIRDDRIDILIDLSGHSNGNRLQVFARKPAPIQVTAWGHATGTGLPAIDYFFADPIAVPAEYRHLFAEKVYDLPCVIPTEAATVQPNSDLPMLERGYVTFGVFNRPQKVTDVAIGLWSRILDGIPGSRLVIKGATLEQPKRRRPIAEKFASLGVHSDRLTILGSTPRDEHLAAIRGVDICLDPFPQNGGVSTWEALRMGVPVVCMLGTWITNRLSASIVSAIGLRDWVADTEDGYLEIARKFASAPEHLRQLRRKLPDLIEASAAGNLDAYTRAVESAYQTMWTRFCATTV